MTQMVAFALVKAHFVLFASAEEDPYQVSGPYLQDSQ